jgi:hypothetical protein
MSLHTLANHLQTAGRGDDSLLVHMTPGEVSGLQSIAMAHGGSLTINPQTGLPEAGFLSGILPMIAGAALAATGVGAPMAALMVGGAGTVATGSLSKGLMMGLGAYGGAGLGAGLLGGAEAAAGGLGSAGTIAAQNAANLGAQATSTLGNTMAGGAAGATGAATGAAAAAPNVLGAATNPNLGGYSLPTGQPSTIPSPTNTDLLAQQRAFSAQQAAAGTPVVGQNAAPSVGSVTSGGTSGGWMDKLKSMPGKAFDLMSGSGPEADKAREEFLKKNKGSLIAAGIGTLGASRDDPRMPKQTKYATHEYDWNRQYNPSSMDPGSTAERTYFADGGLAGLPVEQMSQQNATSDNTRYPMAFQNMPSYSTPSQRPIPQNVVYPATDADTTPYSGTERTMATGGVVALAKGSTAKAAAPAKLTPAEQARANAEKAIAKLKLTEFDNAKIAEPKGGFTSSSINSAYKTALDAQQKEITNIQTLLNSYADPKTGKAKKPEFASAIEYLQGILDSNKKDIDAGTTAKTSALQDFSKATTRGEAIGTKGISSIPIPTVEPGKEKMVIQPDGTFAPEKPAPQYQKLGYGKVTATTGWDNTIKKPYEPDDVSRVFEEVAGRKPTSAELSKYVGATGTLQGLATAVNKSPDIAIPRGKKDPFTDEELQANAKYYWGREMTTGELANYKKANYGNFGALRNALTSANSYVDNLNKINEAQFTKQNAPAVTPATNMDISSVFVDTLQRKPTTAEMKSYLDKKVTKADLAAQLKASEEYGARLVQPKYTDNVSTGANVTTSGVTTVLPKGGGTGLVPPVTYNTPGTLTRAQMDALTQQYAAQPAVAKGSPYAPEQAPQYQIADSMPNRDVNKELGLTGLYQQIAQKSPEIQQGLNFTPGQAQAMASPFANVTPGLVTLQSAATPQPYAPPTPVVPGQQGYSPALTPEEQQILSVLQSQPKNMATGGMTGYNLGGYSDGGRLLKGPGDGVSDSIPATIGDRQPARLADGEFVVPARIVSELGNGSTDAGARKLYAMMQRIQQARGRTVGKNKVAVKSGADKMLPA